MMHSVCLQMVSEKVGGAEGTKLDEEFRDLEKVRMFDVVGFFSVFLEVCTIIVNTAVQIFML